MKSHYYISYIGTKKMSSMINKNALENKWVSSNKINEMSIYLGLLSALELTACTSSVSVFGWSGA